MAADVAVVAIQGDYALHARALEEIGARVRLARTAAEILGASHLVLPGGESTTWLKFFEFEPGLEAAIVEFHRRGRPMFVTCAGAILVAREVRAPVQRSLGLLDAVIERNAYGRQIASFSAAIDCPGMSRAGGEPTLLDAVFIRAPILREVGPGVEVLARLETPVLVRENNLLAATFHPEASADRRIQRYFLAMEESAANAPQSREASIARA